MNAVWVDTGNDADYDKLRRYGITQPYYASTDPRVTAAYLRSVKDKGFTPGIYLAWNWFTNTIESHGSLFADKVDAELKRINWEGNPAVCVDIETHDVIYIRSFFLRWRQLRPTRRTDWTLEGFQGGLFDTATVKIVNDANVGICPQPYTGNMTPLQHGVITDLQMAGFRSDKLMLMYDAARLPYRWNGYAFTQGRLP